MLDVAWSPGARQLRQFAWACIPGFALFGWAAHRWGAGWPVSVALAALGVVLCVCGLARPTSLRLPWVILMTVAAPIGWLVMRVGLLVFFFLVLVPLALVFRAAGRDALGMRARPAWKPSAPARPPSSYYRAS